MASSYHNLQMYNEAINTYNVIIKNKMFSNAGRLRINIGNIYYAQRNYAQAIKYYRMALDQIPQTHKQVRYCCYNTQSSIQRKILKGIYILLSFTNETLFTFRFQDHNII